MEKNMHVLIKRFKTVVPGPTENHKGVLQKSSGGKTKNKQTYK